MGRGRRLVFHIHWLFAGRPERDSFRQESWVMILLHLLPAAGLGLSNVGFGNIGVAGSFGRAAVVFVSDL